MKGHVVTSQNQLSRTLRSAPLISLLPTPLLLWSASQTDMVSSDTHSLPPPPIDVVIMLTLFLIHLHSHSHLHLCVRLHVRFAFEFLLCSWLRQSDTFCRDFSSSTKLLLLRLPTRDGRFETGTSWDYFVLLNRTI